MAVDADPGTTFPAPATALPTPLDLSAAASAAVRELAAVPGATYAAAVDERSGGLLAESGAVGSGAALTAMLTWARRTAALPGPDGLDDLVVTTDRAFHVIRLASVSGVPVWAYLRVDRKRGNLALARRAGAAAARPRPSASRPAARSGGTRPALPRRPSTALPKRPPTALPAPCGATATRPPSARPATTEVETAVRAALPAPACGWSADTATLHRLLAGLRQLA
jgi:hypothetical protein